MTDKNYTEAQFNGAVHAAVQKAVTGMAANSGAALDTGIRQRMASLLSGGYDYADTLHNIYLDYGYPITLSFFNHWNMYRRFGVARRGCDLYPDQTWLDSPIIVTDNPQLDRDLRKLTGDEEMIDPKAKNLGLWRRLHGLDRRQRVGRYAGLFVRVRDGKKPREPIEGVLSGIDSLADLVPLYEGQLKVLSTQDDTTKDDYGMPTMYQFNGGSAGNRNENQASSFEIHPDRIIIAAEGADNGGVYGVPAQECVYNDLMDLRKILGGGGEGFYKNAAQNVIFELKDAASAVKNKSLLDQFNEQYDEFSQNRFRRAMWTPGLESKTLESSLISSDPFASNSWQAVSAGFNIPTSLLAGNQTGRLAGDQDIKGFLGEVQSRRVNYATDLIVDTINWMIRFGVLPYGRYSVEWPDAQAPSREQKLGNAEKMADINKRVFESAGQAPFSGEEIREEAGFDVEGMPGEDEGDLPDETLEEGEDDET